MKKKKNPKTTQEVTAAKPGIQGTIRTISVAGSTTEKTPKKKKNGKQEKPTIFLRWRKR